MREVPGPLTIALVVVDARPGIAAVIRAEDAALFRFDQRVDTVGVAAGDRDAAASPDPTRQSVTFKPLPSRAAVDRFIDAAARAAAIKRIWRADHLPDRRE